MTIKKYFLQLAVALFSAIPAFAQPTNNECSGATSLGTLPTPGACVSGLQNGVPVTFNNQTTVGATAGNPYVYQTGCSGGNMTTFALDTWYSFVASGTTANINITGFPNANVALWSGNCGNLLGRGCTILPNGGSGTLTVTQISPGQTYYIQVSGNSTTATDNSFSIAVDNDIDCDDCMLNATITANPPPVNGGYQPGQQVQFCYTVNGWDQQNTNWFHGVQITMGTGWTGTITNAVPAATEQNIIGPGFDGAWYYFPTGIGNVNGQNWGPGFYFETAQNGTAPNNNYGDDCDGTACSWTFCWTLTVKTNCTPGTPLTVTVNTSGDGESGSWSDNGCNDDASTVFTAIQICCTAPTMASTPQSCVGVNDGTATATHGTGASPWDYAWTGPGGFTASTINSPAASNTIIGLAPGTYNVTVTDANGCVSSNTVTVGPGINCCTATANNNGPYCAGGTIQLNGTGGGSYSWTGPNNFTSSIQSPTLPATAAAAGTYTVSINLNGCIATATTTVVVNPVATVNANNDQSVCAGGSVTLAGSFGGGATSAVWSANSGSFSNSTSMSSSYTPAITTGSVTLTLATNDPAGPCPAVNDQVVITIITPPTVTINSPTVCAGTSATVTATPGSAGTYTYTWTVPSGVTNPGNVPSFSTTTAGTYTVTISASGCTSTPISGTVTVNPVPTVSVNSPTVCAGTSATVTATPGVAGTYTYTWSVP
ncbi:MAG: hypothetical protein ACK46O_07265, partial [Flavobacteriia bacterium]